MLWYCSAGAILLCCCCCCSAAVVAVTSGGLLQQSPATPQSCRGGVSLLSDCLIAVSRYLSHSLPHCGPVCRVQLQLDDLKRQELDRNRLAALSRERELETTISNAAEHGQSAQAVQLASGLLLTSDTGDGGTTATEASLCSRLLRYGRGGAICRSIVYIIHSIVLSLCVN